MTKENFNIVIVGHVDHGKSTLLGRLFADTGSLPDGKIEQVKEICRQQGKEFEYAFLFDALIEEQEQGITIDTARTFFKWKNREYILIDAPGHKEFLKNMISGAARAEGAFLLIDVHEGVMAQSKQHGQMLSLLGINQVAIIANKMDLVDYDQNSFEAVKQEYLKFLKPLNVVPSQFIPVSAREGDNIAKKSKNMPWYDGPTALDTLALFKKKAGDLEQPLRLPVQDVYKFDSRRIVSGRVTSGAVRVGDRVVFSPSNKSAIVKSIEAFNVQPPPLEGIVGESIGITLDEQIFVERGEIVSHPQKAPILSSALKCNVFWMGRESLKKGKTYKIRLATQEEECEVVHIERIIDATNLQTDQSQELVKTNEVAEITLETKKPIAFDYYRDFADTGRFVLVDRYDVSGGGIIMQAIHEEREMLLEVARRRDFSWKKSNIPMADRRFRNGHQEALLLFTGGDARTNSEFAKKLESSLFRGGRNTYLLDTSNLRFGLDADISADSGKEVVRRFGEAVHLLLTAGLIVISSLENYTLSEIQDIKTLVSPSKT
ncbi:MAG: GTP-binding protein, partial [Nitrospinota bacterium]